MGIKTSSHWQNASDVNIIVRPFGKSAASSPTGPNIINIINISCRRHGFFPQGDLTRLTSCGSDGNMNANMSIVSFHCGQDRFEERLGSKWSNLGPQMLTILDCRRPLEIFLSDLCCHFLYVCVCMYMCIYICIPLESFPVHVFTV